YEGLIPAAGLAVGECAFHAAAVRSQAPEASLAAILDYAAREADALAAAGERPPLRIPYPAGALGEGLGEDLWSAPTWDSCRGAPFRGAVPPALWVGDDLRRVVVDCGGAAESATAKNNQSKKKKKKSAGTPAGDDARRRAAWRAEAAARAR